jgi:hypothetical protein
MSYRKCAVISCNEEEQYCITSNLKKGFFALTPLCQKHYTEYVKNKLDPIRLDYDQKEYKLD